MANYSCPHCGSVSYHFSHRRGAFVCDGCQRVILTDAEREANEKYERDKARAKQHLQVGNWREVTNLITPYLTSRPNDRELYLILLMAVTKDYSDYLLDNPAARADASSYWYKLDRLRCVNQVMRRYARKRQTYIAEEKSLLSAKIGILIGVCLLLTMITICLFCSGENGAAFLVFSIISWVLAFLRISGMSVRDRYILKYKFSSGTGNPF